MAFILLAPLPFKDRAVRPYRSVAFFLVVSTALPRAVHVRGQLSVRTGSNQIEDLIGELKILRAG
jgi:hypothetical protein